MEAVMTTTKRISLFLFANLLLATASLSAAEPNDDTRAQQSVKRIADKIYYPSIAKKFAFMDKVVAKLYLNGDGDLAGFEIIEPSDYDAFNREVFSTLRGESKAVVDAPETLQVVKLVIHFKK
jgi:outer membrane biosynthesis protein TonB